MNTCIKNNNESKYVISRVKWNFIKNIKNTNNNKIEKIIYLWLWEIEREIMITIIKHIIKQ